MFFGRKYFRTVKIPSSFSYFHPANTPKEQIELSICASVLGSETMQRKLFKSSFECCFWFSKKPFGWCAASKKVKKQFCTTLLRVNQNHIRRLIYDPSWFTSYIAVNDLRRKLLKNSLQKYWCSIYKYCYNYCK